MTLYYVPLEPYKDRYTMQWSAPETGWLERNWRRTGVDYVRVEGDLSLASRPIKTGCVLDAVKRSKFAFAQVDSLLEMADRGDLNSTDVIYFDDFWHPGIEALPYAFHLMGVRPRMYAFLHAQSVDEFDFTHPMRHWMRHFERGIGEVLDGIFVCGPCLRDLVVHGGIAPREKVHVTGHPFNSEEVLERMPAWYRAWLGEGPSLPPRANQVVYSSRWDREKNPRFFLDVARKVLAVRSDARFVVCTGAEKIRSNDPRLVTDLHKACADTSGGIALREGLTKEQYYRYLAESKIQFNCADQDFVAITLLESSVAGCYPVYPYFRSFPETFLHRPGFMYERLDADHAARLVISVLDRDDLWTKQQVTSRKWIHSRFDVSWIRMLKAMNLTGTEVPDPYEAARW